MGKQNTAATAAQLDGIVTRLFEPLPGDILWMLEGGTDRPICGRVVRGKAQGGWCRILVDGVEKNTRGPSQGWYPSLREAIDDKLGWLLFSYNRKFGPAQYDHANPLIVRIRVLMLARDGIDV